MDSDVICATRDFVVVRNQRPEQRMLAFGKNKHFGPSGIPVSGERAAVLQATPAQRANLIFYWRYPPKMVRGTQISRPRGQNGVKK